MFKSGLTRLSGPFVPEFPPKPSAAQAFDIASFTYACRACVRTTLFGYFHTTDPGAPYLTTVFWSGDVGNTVGGRGGLYNLSSHTSFKAVLFRKGRTVASTALSKNISKEEYQHRDLSTSLEMTKGRVALSGRKVAGRKQFFIFSGGPKAHGHCCQLGTRLVVFSSTQRACVPAWKNLNCAFVGAEVENT
jgi:hypothetical protein